MPKSKQDPKLTAALAAIMALSHEQRSMLLEAVALAVDTQKNPPPEWHRPLVRKALAEHRANPDKARTSGAAFAEIDASLAKLRGK